MKSDASPTFQTSRLMQFLFAVLGAGLFGLGEWLNGLGTSGWQMLVWGFFISATVLLHATLFINSRAHVLAALTPGKGWHNNRRRYMNSARQGFYWWEIDPTYRGLKVLSWLRLIRDLKPVPRSIYGEAGHQTRHAE